MPVLSHKTKQFLGAAVKIFLVLLATYFVGRKLLEADFWFLSNHLLNRSSFSLYVYISLLLLVTCLNWSLEIKKWRTLVSRIRALSFTESLHQVLVAHITGFVTPAKAGEYGAKALFFYKDDWKKILFLNFLGNMYQLLATLFFGLLGLGIIAFLNSGPAVFFWLMAVMMCLLFYFILPRFLNRIQWSLKGYNWAKVRKFLKTIPKEVKKQAQILSFARYLVFAHQFYFVLWVLGNEQPYTFTMACISAVYLLSSLLPVMQFFDLMVRGGIALLVFGWFTIPEEIVLTAVLVMWLLNVFIPLLPSAYFLGRSKRSSIAHKSSW